MREQLLEPGAQQSFRSTPNGAPSLANQSAHVHSRLQSPVAADSIATSARLVAALGASQSAPYLLSLQQKYGNRYVQRIVARSKDESAKGQITPDVASAIERKRGAGNALDAGVGTRMESLFGTDFRGVRVHTDGEADILNRALSAEAFTTGQDIFFSRGAYNPASESGRRLLSHELTHVVQQGGHPGHGDLVLGEPGDKYEQEAEAVAKQLGNAPASALSRSAQAPKSESSGSISGLVQAKPQPIPAADAPVPQAQGAATADSKTLAAAPGTPKPTVGIEDEFVKTNWFIDFVGTGQNIRREGDVVEIDNLVLGPMDQNRKFRKAGDASISTYTPLLMNFPHQKGDGVVEGVASFQHRQDLRPKVAWDGKIPTKAVQKEAEAAATRKISELIDGGAGDWDDVERQATAEAAKVVPVEAHDADSEAKTPDSVPQVSISWRPSLQGHHFKVLYQAARRGNYTIQVEKGKATTRTVQNTAPAPPKPVVQAPKVKITSTDTGGGTRNQVDVGGKGGSVRADVSGKSSTDHSADAKASSTHVQDQESFSEKDTSEAATKMTDHQINSFELIRTMVQRISTPIVGPPQPAQNQKVQGKEPSWTGRAWEWLKGKGKTLWNIGMGKLVGAAKSRLFKWLKTAFKLGWWEGVVWEQLLDWGLSFVGDKIASVLSFSTKPEIAAPLEKSCGSTYIKDVDEGMFSSHTHEEKREQPCIPVPDHESERISEDNIKQSLDAVEDLRSQTQTSNETEITRLYIKDQADSSSKLRDKSDNGVKGTVTATGPDPANHSDYQVTNPNRQTQIEIDPSANAAPAAAPARSPGSHQVVEIGAATVRVLVPTAE